MSGRTMKFAAALLVMSLLLIGIVGAAQAQTSDPVDPPADPPNRLQQMQERLGPEAYGQMIQRMTERHGAEAAGQMLQRMATADANANCDGTGHSGMMGRSDATTGWFGGLVNGFQRGAGRMMGGWH